MEHTYLCRSFKTNIGFSVFGASPCLAIPPSLVLQATKGDMMWNTMGMYERPTAWVVG